jgi:hypothetical protein
MGKPFGWLVIARQKAKATLGLPPLIKAEVGYRLAELVRHGAGLRMPPACRGALATLAAAHRDIGHY